MAGINITTAIAAHVLQVADEAGAERQVIWWDGGGEKLPEGLFDLAYVARASSYRGAREVQVELVAVRPGAGREAQVEVKTEVEVVDYRNAAQPRARLAELLTQGDIAVWQEEEAAGDVPGYDRRNLPRAGTLAIWTIPPGPAEPRAALAQTRPARICLFAEDPGMDQPQAFLRRLAGLGVSTRWQPKRAARACSIWPRPPRNVRPPCAWGWPGWPRRDMCASWPKPVARRSWQPATASPPTQPSGPRLQHTSKPRWTNRLRTGRTITT